MGHSQDDVIINPVFWLKLSVCLYVLANPAYMYVLGNARSIDSGIMEGSLGRNVF